MIFLSLFTVLQACGFYLFSDSRVLYKLCNSSNDGKPLTGLSTEVHIIEGRFFPSTVQIISETFSKTGTRHTMARMDEVAAKFYW